jgi:hypothetical protein
MKALIVHVSNEEIEAAWTQRSESVFARVFCWVKEWDGKPIKKKKVLEQLQAKESSFDSAIRRNPNLKVQFEEFKANARAMGYPNGYYAKGVQHSEKKA